jgi:hypothetical protein
VDNGRCAPFPSRAIIGSVNSISLPNGEEARSVVGSMFALQFRNESY